LIDKAIKVSDFDIEIIPASQSINASASVALDNFYIYDHVCIIVIFHTQLLVLLKTN